MSAARDKGTRAETAVVNWLMTNGFPQAERRTTRGARDAGDVAGIPGIVIEVKNEQRQRLAEWMDEATREAANTGQLGTIGVVWHKRRGYSSASCWYVTMEGGAFGTLLRLARAAAEAGLL